MENAELQRLYGDPTYQAMISGESKRGISDADLEAVGHKPYASDADTNAHAAQLSADFIERLDGPLILEAPGDD